MRFRQSVTGNHLDQAPAIPWTSRRQSPGPVAGNPSEQSVSGNVLWPCSRRKSTGPVLENPGPFAGNPIVLSTAILLHQSPAISLDQSQAISFSPVVGRTSARGSLSAIISFRPDTRPRATPCDGTFPTIYFLPYHLLHFVTFLSALLPSVPTTFGDCLQLFKCKCVSEIVSSCGTSVIK